MKAASRVKSIRVKVAGTWIAANMEQLEKDDIVRLFESDGTPVVIEGQTEFVITADATFGSVLA